MRNPEMRLSRDVRPAAPMRIKVTAICYDAHVLVIFRVKQRDTGRTA